MRKGKSVFSRGAMFADLTLTLFCFWCVQAGSLFLIKEEIKCGKKVCIFQRSGTKSQKQSTHVSLQTDRETDMQLSKAGYIHLSPILSFSSLFLFIVFHLSHLHRGSVQGPALLFFYFFLFYCEADTHIHTHVLCC